MGKPNGKTMNTNLNLALSPDQYEEILRFKEARIEAMQKRIEALEAIHNPVLKAEFETQDFIFNKLFR